MNIEKVKRYQWACGVIKFEGEDDFLFTYDIDKVIEPFDGKIRIEKMVFEELKNQVEEVKDFSLDPNFVWDMMEVNRIAMIRPCSKPLSVFDKLPEFDYWTLLLAEMYITDFIDTGKMAIRIWAKKENDSEVEN